MTLAQLLNKVEGGSATKAEEMEVLRRVAGKCGEGSYLHSLLGGELLVWADKQIQDDIAPDIWGAVKAQRISLQAVADQCREEIKDAETRVAEATEDNMALARKLEVVEESAGEAKEYAKRLEDENRDWSDTWAEANDIIKAVAEEAQEAWFQRRKVDPELVRALTARWFRGGSESC